MPQQGHSGSPLAMSRARLKARVAIECGTWRCIGASAARAESFGYGRRFESSGVFFDSQSLAHQKTVGRNTEAGVMMEAAPVPPFVVMQSKLGFQLLVIALDTPATHRDIHQRLQ